MSNTRSADDPALLLEYMPELCSFSAYLVAIGRVPLAIVELEKKSNKIPFLP